MEWNSRGRERCGQKSAVAEAPIIRHGPAVDRDAGLVERLRRQEAGATEALVATYGDRLYRLAIRITGNRSDAEEVVQDALWSVTRKIDTFRGMAAFWSWVYRITANAAFQQQRGRRIERNRTSWACFDETDEHLDWSPRLKDPVLQTELHAMLCEAIDELPAEHRATFVLHDVEGLSNREIAETLQIKLATVKSRVHRARLLLRSRLAAYVGARPVTRCLTSSPAAGPAITYPFAQQDGDHGDPCLVLAKT
jgi:RNA polymerase sigma-70 factor (ECF subfamily)